MTEIYNKLKQAPAWALRTIQAGRLKGKSDINPQWRYQTLDETFGLCGDGWRYELIEFFTLPGSNNEIAAFARINFYIKLDGKWSAPIPGFGGSMFVSNEKNGLYTNDEAYKMAVTDALSVATKMLGMAADVYAGKWDGSKYCDRDDIPSFEAAAKAEKAAKTRALNAAVKTGEYNEPKKAQTLEERYNAALPYLKNAQKFEKKSVIDSVNTLMSDLKNAGCQDWYEAIMAEYDRLTKVDDAIPY